MFKALKLAGTLAALALWGGALAQAPGGEGYTYNGEAARNAMRAEERLWADYAGVRPLPLADFAGHDAAGEQARTVGGLSDTLIYVSRGVLRVFVNAGTVPIVLEADQWIGIEPGASFSVEADADARYVVFTPVAGDGLGGGAMPQWLEP